jgi:oligoribonuclease
MSSDAPAASATRWVWLDLEMTGLSPERDRIIELAMVVTDGELNVVAEAPVWAVHQSDDALAGMDAWNTATHGRSGLVARVRASTLDEAAVQAEALAWLRQHLPAKASPMCGNSIGQDRRFLALHMPQLEAFFHYRNIDISTLKELSRAWFPAEFAAFRKKTRHEALSDVYESIDEARYYREAVFKSRAASTH